MTIAPTSLGHEHRPRRIIAVAIAVALLVLGAVLLTLYLDDTGSETSGVIHGSGVTTTETRDVAAFTAVDLAGAASLNVQVGDEQRVEVTADDNLVGLIETEVGEDGVLVVRTRDSFQTAGEMRVDLTVPSLTSAHLTGSGLVVVDGVQADEFEVVLSGSGSLRVTGSADTLRATVNGSGNGLLGGLIARAVDASVPGTGVLEVHATETLSASVSGTGTIFYSGKPADVTKSVTGVGVILER